MGRMQVRTVEDALPPVLPNSGLSEVQIGEGAMAALVGADVLHGHRTGMGADHLAL
jgi:hypothetical protein